MTVNLNNVQRAQANVAYLQQKKKVSDIQAKVNNASKLLHEWQNHTCSGALTERTKDLQIQSWKYQLAQLSSTLEIENAKLELFRAQLG